MSYKQDKKGVTVKSVTSHTDVGSPPAFIEKKGVTTHNLVPLNRPVEKKDIEKLRQELKLENN